MDLVDEDGTYLNAANTFQVTVDNIVPTLSISGNAHVNEGATYSLTLGGLTVYHGDPIDQWVVHWGDGLSDTYTSNGAKTHAYDDGPRSNAIAVDLIDEDGTYLNRANAISVTVSNVAPTAMFVTTPGVKINRLSIPFTFTGQSDPSHADTVAGFKYYFDFNNNGSFTDPGDINGSASAMATHKFKHQGSYTVLGRIQDKDGGFNDYYVTLNVIDTDLVIAGTDAGTQAEVKAYDAATGAVKFDLSPFSGFTGGVRVAQGDLNGDGYADIIVAAGAGGGPNVKVYDGKTGATLFSFFAYAPTFTGGVYIAAGDVTGDGIADIIVGAGAGGGPHVKVIDGTKLNQVDAQGSIKDSALVYQFFAYAPTFTGGIRVAAGDVNGDGIADLVIGAGVGGGPHVRVFNGTNLNLLFSFMAFDPSFTGGIFVAAGDINGDGRSDLVVSQGSGNAARVRTFSGMDSHMMGEITPFPVVIDPFSSSPNPDGLRVLAIDRDGDGNADVEVGTGSQYRNRVRIYKGTTLAAIDDLLPFGSNFLGGVFVG